MNISIVGFCLGLLLLIIPIYILQLYKVNFLYKILRATLKRIDGSVLVFCLSMEQYMGECPLDFVDDGGWYDCDNHES